MCLRESPLNVNVGKCVLCKLCKQNSIMKQQVDVPPLGRNNMLFCNCRHFSLGDGKYYQAVTDRKLRCLCRISKPAFFRTVESNQRNNNESLLAPYIRIGEKP